MPQGRLSPPTRSRLEHDWRPLVTTAARRSRSLASGDNSLVIVLTVTRQAEARRPSLSGERYSETRRHHHHRRSRCTAAAVLRCAHCTLHQTPKLFVLECEHGHSWARKNLSWICVLLQLIVHTWSVCTRCAHISFIDKLNRGRYFALWKCRPLPAFLAFVRESAF